MDHKVVDYVCAAEYLFCIEKEEYPLRMFERDDHSVQQVRHHFSQTLSHQMCL